MNNTLALAFFVKNEAHCITHMLDSVFGAGKPVDEIVLLDTGSTDETLRVFEEYMVTHDFKNYRIYKAGLIGFGDTRTITAHLCKSDWILMLDADETIDNFDEVRVLVDSNLSQAYALPRKRWLDLEKTKQTELEAYPDWQVRLFSNSKKHKFRRDLHEEFTGTAVCNIEHKLVINHFQDVFKDEARKKERDKLYQTLAPKAKVHVHGGKPNENNS
jgi:glycosyltransferase involved in cell wall biosynthesis